MTPSLETLVEQSHACRAAQEKHTKSLFKQKGVVCVGLGTKYTKGKNTGNICVWVGVKQKLPKEQIDAWDLIPETLGPDGALTDVVEVGEIRALEGDEQAPKAINTKARHRPIFPGISVGHPQVTAGTIGCFVRRGSETVLLSNNHVIANTNAAQIGDPVLQPGAYDGGSVLYDIVGRLRAFVPISFEGDGGGGPPDCSIALWVEKALNWLAGLLGSKHRVRAEKEAPAASPNYVDAAVASVTVDWNAVVPQIGVPSGTIAPAPNLPVRKFGRTTLYRESTIRAINATISVGYGNNKVAIFQEQIVTGPISAGGDSGSAVFDSGTRLVGLLFAGSDQVTICNPINRVFQALNLTL